MRFEFNVLQRVTVVSLAGVDGVVLDRRVNEDATAHLYIVAFQRFGNWSIEEFPEMSIQSARSGGFLRRLFRRKEAERPSYSQRQLGELGRLPADVKMPPAR